MGTLKKFVRRFDPRKRTLPALAENLVAKPRVFRAPPLTRDLVQAIKLIAPQYDLKMDEKSRQFWEADQNASSWGEFEALAPLLRSLPKPAKVLEMGPGLGRSVVFFAKTLDWGDAEFHLYESNGKKTKYTHQGPRFNDSFCGSTESLEKVLKFNGISKFRIFDAEDLDFKISNLPDRYDVIYSFFAVGWHWALEHFFDEIMSVMHDKSVAFFTVPNDFVEFDKLKQVYSKRVSYQQADNVRNQILILSRDPAMLAAVA